MEIQQANPNSLKVLQLHLRELASKQGKVGWFESAVYPNGTKTAYVAAIQEFGSAQKKIPPRPFMRPAVAENQKQWEALAAQGANRVLAGKSTAGDVMDLLTLSAQNAVSKNIATLISPKLSESTLANRRRRGNSSTKPLEDTGYMSATLTSVVENATS